MISIKGDMWALNALVSAGLIAIFLLGFFITATLVLPGDVAEIKASVVGSSYGSQLLSLFRVPVRGIVIADFISFGSKLPGSPFLDFSIVRDVVNAFVPLDSKHLDSVHCSDIEDSLRFVYGNDAGYRLAVDGQILCSKGAVKENPVVAEFVLPSYAGEVYNISIGVFK